jgi:hypothetical protein
MNGGSLAYGIGLLLAVIVAQDVPPQEVGGIINNN